MDLAANAGSGWHMCESTMLDGENRVAVWRKHQIASLHGENELGRSGITATTTWGAGARENCRENWEKLKGGGGEGEWRRLEAAGLDAAEDTVAWR